MYEIYKEVMITVNSFMQNPKICEFLTVKQIEDNVPDRKNIIKFGMILKQMDQYLKEQTKIEQTIRGKLLTLVKMEKSFLKLTNFIQIVNTEYTIEFSAALLDELQYVTEICTDDMLTTSDIIYEILRRAKGNVQNDHIRQLLAKQIKHPITIKLYQLCQPAHITEMLLHNEKIIYILIAICNQEQIPVPEIIECLHLTGDQMRLRIDTNLIHSILSIQEVQGAAQELGYDNVQLAQQGLLDLKLPYYRSFLEISEQDLIDSALSIMVMQRVELDQRYVRQLLLATSNLGVLPPQIIRLNNLFNQLLETSIQIIEKRQAQKNLKSNLHLVLYQVVEKMTKDRHPFPQIIDFMKVANNGVLKLDVTEPMIRRNYHLLARTLTELLHVTSQIQLSNYCKTKILDPNCKLDELQILSKMLALIYQERSKCILELKSIFDQPETNKTIMVLNLQKDKYSSINEQIKKLQHYSQQNKIIELDSDDNEEQHKIVKK